MKLDILTPKKTFFSGEVDSVMLPGAAGAFTVLSGHAPMISSLRPSGKITYTQGDKSVALIIDGGFVEVWRNRVTICANVQEQIQEPKEQP